MNTKLLVVSSKWGENVFLNSSRLSSAKKWWGRGASECREKLIGNLRQLLINQSLKFQFSIFAMCFIVICALFV